MERLERAAFIGALIGALEEQGSWCGETHIQKTGYLVQKMGNVPLDFNYIMYKHGPFSFDFRDELTAMRADGFLSLKVQPYPYGPSIGVTESGKKLLEKFDGEISNYRETISFFVTKLAAKGVVALERLSTALYVTDEMENATSQQKADRICEMKPHISPEIAAESIKEIDEMTREYRQIKTQ